MGLTFRFLHESGGIRLGRAFSDIERNTEAASIISGQVREAKTIIDRHPEVHKRYCTNARIPPTKSLSAGLLTPFEKALNDIEEGCDRFASEAKQISLELKQARRIHIGGYAFSAALITLLLPAVIWFDSARLYAQHEERLIQQAH